MSSDGTIDTSAVGNPEHPAPTVAEGKGKGKAVDIDLKDVEMEEDDDDEDDDEETGAEDEKRESFPLLVIETGHALFEGRSQHVSITLLSRPDWTVVPFTPP